MVPLKPCSKIHDSIWFVSLNRFRVNQLLLREVGLVTGHEMLTIWRNMVVVAAPSIPLLLGLCLGGQPHISVNLIIYSLLLRTQKRLFLDNHAVLLAATTSPKVTYSTAI